MLSPWVKKALIILTVARQELSPVPYDSVHIENTNGAGDNFSGGLIYGLHHDMVLEDAITLGHKCAVHVLGRKSPRCEQNLKEIIK